MQIRRTVAVHQASNEPGRDDVKRRNGDKPANPSDRQSSLRAAMYLMAASWAYAVTATAGVRSPWTGCALRSPALRRSVFLLRAGRKRVEQQAVDRHARGVEIAARFRQRLGAALDV